MKKYFVFSDVHGFYDELIRDLTSAGFDMDNENHILISCGDNFDRGPKSFEMYKFLSEFPKERKILIRGNHEYLLYDLALRKETISIDSVNGTANTWVDFQIKLKDIEIKEVVEFIEGMNDYFELEDYLFVHGFIPCIDYTNATELEWKKAAWIDSTKLMRNLPELNKTIVIGHKATSYFHPYNDMFIQAKRGKKCGVIAIDATTVINKKVNILVINEDGTYDNKKYMCILKPVII